MKIVITEEQFNKLYNAPDRPILTEVEYIIDIIQEEDGDAGKVFDYGTSKDTKKIVK